jgi:mRNA interferase HicA
VKRGELLRELGRAGCHFHRHGKRYDLYIKPANGKKAPIPRHAEIKNSLCELIRRQLGLN